MGLWSIDVGSIIATLLASIWVTPNGAWGWSFVVPGLIMAALGAAAFLFLVPGEFDACVCLCVCLCVCVCVSVSIHVQVHTCVYV